MAPSPRPQSRTTTITCLTRLGLVCGSEWCFSACWCWHRFDLSSISQNYTKMVTPSRNIGMRGIFSFASFHLPVSYFPAFSMPYFSWVTICARRMNWIQRKWAPKPSTVFFSSLGKSSGILMSSILPHSECKSPPLITIDSILVIVIDWRRQLTK